jgi:hypothetical protein
LYFIKSTRLVPPAMTCAAGSAATRVWHALRHGLWYKKRGHASELRFALCSACLIAATMFGYAPQRHMLPLISSRISSVVWALPSRRSIRRQSSSVLAYNTPTERRREQ